MHATRGGSAHAGEQLLADAPAGAACLRTAAAVLMVRRVALAFVAACPAGSDARVEDRACERGIKCRLPDQHRGGRVTHVRAVEVQANAAHEVADVGLAEAGIGTAAAGRRAPDDLVDAASELLVVEECLPRMRPQHLEYGHFFSFVAQEAVAPRGSA